MKWVQLREGHYKLVEDDDPRPAVKLKNKSGSPTIKYIPPWKKYEKPMFIGSSDEQLAAADKFAAEREEAIKKDSKAARWEKSRRDWFQSQKRKWRDNRLKELKERGM